MSIEFKRDASGKITEAQTRAETRAAVGLVGAIATTRLLTSMLYEVQRNDPMVYAGAAILLGAVARVQATFRHRARPE